MALTPKQARQARYDYEAGKLTFEELKTALTGFRFSNSRDLDFGMSLDDIWPAPHNPMYVLGTTMAREPRHELVRHARRTVEPDSHRRG